MTRSLLIVCALGLLTTPVTAQLSVGPGPTSPTAARDTFCSGDIVTDSTIPTRSVALASTFCLEGVSRVEVSERFIGDGRLLTGVGFWFVYTDTIPSSPTFVVTIYNTNAGGCPTGPALFSAACSAVNIGPGTGADFANPVECFIDFKANGAPPFLKDTGVEYSLTIMNSNCSGGGEYAYWGEGAGDGNRGCIDAPDFGFAWTPLVDAGFEFDLAFYLCNEETSALRSTGWGAVKALYR